MSIFKFASVVALPALLATTLAGGQAQAWTEVGDVKSISFSAADTISKIHVISTDGKKWNAFKSGSIPFYASMNVQMKHRSWIHNAGVVLGQCHKHTCLAMPKLWYMGVGAEDWASSANISLDTSKIPLTDAGGIAVIPEGDAMIARCNDHLEVNGPTKSYSFEKTLAATLVVDTAKRGVGEFNPWGSGIGAFPVEANAVESDTFKVQVVCDPVIKPSADDLANPMPDFKPTDVKLFLATINGINTDGPNPATKCPALRVTTRVQTSKAGGVDVRLWRKQGNGQATSEFKSAWASYDAGKNGYFADIVRTEKFDATTYLQFMAETIGGTFAPSTPWKDITVHCTGAGGGGLANDMPNTGEDPLPPPKPDKPKPQVDTGSDDLAVEPRPGDDKPKAKWKGTVTLADSAGSKKQCPRKGQVMFDVSRNEPGNFKYKISCSNGQGFGGSVASFNQGSGVFHAIAAHDLNINRTRKIQCTLQEVKDSGARVTIDKGSFDYTCNTPAIDPQADDLATPTVPPKPTHNTQKPGVSIFCKPGFMLKGKTCVKKPELVVLCKSGEVLRGKTCVKKPQVSILCAKGFKLEGKTCVKIPRLVNRAVKKPAVRVAN